MKRGLIALSFVILAATMTQQPVEARDYWGPAPVPVLLKGQGWLTVTNHDNRTYTILSVSDDINVYEGHIAGGMVVRPGETHTVGLAKRTYDLRGNNSDKIKVRVREGRSTTVSLEPYGGGLAAVVNDGDKVRNGIIFSSYPVVIPAPAPPTVIVNRPPPPPIIVSRPPPPPPPVYHRPPHGRPGYGGPGRPGGHRPPPPPPGGHRRGNDSSWGFMFGVNKR